MFRPKRICLKCHQSTIERAVAVHNDFIWWCANCGTYYDKDVTMAKSPNRKPVKIKDTTVDGQKLVVMDRKGEQENG